MKKESRILEYLVDQEYFIGLVRRRESIEHIIIERNDDGLLARLADKKELMEVRKPIQVYSDGSPRSLIVRKIIGSEENTPVSDVRVFLESLRDEIEKLEERLKAR